MEISLSRIVFRSFKLSLAVLFCILIFHFGDRGAPMTAAMAAVAASLKKDLHETIDSGKATVFGNVIGGAMALLYFVITEVDHDNFKVEVVMLPLFVAAVAILCGLLNDYNGIVSAISTTILITLSVSYGESFQFALDRVIDTFIGTIIAVGINVLIRPNQKDLKKAIEADRKLLTQKQEELNRLERELERKKR